MTPALARLALDGVFRCQGEPATCSFGGLSRSILVIPQSPDQLSQLGFAEVVQERPVFRVRRSELADVQAGAILTVGDRRYLVRSSRVTDPLRLTLDLECCDAESA